jgi:DegV family protein with EDD domain
VIGLCTDSNAQLPPELAARFGVEVVPLSVSIDGVDHLEGVDLGADEFYERLAAEPAPTISTAAPSPGRFAVAYERLAAAGATEILSVHIGSALSGTCNAARLAAGQSPVPVRLVDTGTASFAIACAVRAAGDALEQGAGVDEAAAAASTVAAACGNVFVVGTLDLARAGGRLDGSATGSGLTVLALVDGAMRPVASAASSSDAADLLADAVVRSGDRLRVGVGHADASSLEVADELTRRLEGHPAVHDVVRYRVGPSVGVHTGPGTAGAVFHPHL